MFLRELETIYRFAPLATTLSLASLIISLRLVVTSRRNLLTYRRLVQETNYYREENSRLRRLLDIERELGKK